jgi:outer membrane biosynthesis protein TonB
MGRLSASIIAFALALAATLGLLACGEGGDAELLPGATAEEINANLDQVQRLADEGDCVGADDAAEQVSLQVEGLDGVDARLKRALTEGANRLREVVAGCEEESEEPEEIVEPEEEETTEPEETTKDEEKREKDRERSEREEEETEETTESQTQPPPSKEEKGNEPSETETPSESGGAEPPPGGLSPSAPAGEG